MTSILDGLKQKDTMESLTSRLESLESSNARLLQAVRTLSENVKGLDEDLTAMSTSQQPAQASQQSGVETRLSEIERNQNELLSTLAELAKTIEGSRRYELPSGQTVTQADLQAFDISQQTNAQVNAQSQTITSLASKVEALTKEQRGKRSVIYKADTSEVTGEVMKQLKGEVQQAVTPLVDGMAASVQATSERFEKDLRAFEHRLSQVEAKRVGEFAEMVNQVDERADQMITKVDKHAGRVTWGAVGRFCQALIPLTAAIIVVGGLTWTGTQFLGVAPVLAWLWSMFTAAQAWWSKTLIALAAVALVALLAWLIFSLLKWLDGEFRRW